jgi:hypothetical protein
MVDFTKTHELRAYIMETTGGPAAGGLTVRDVFACTAMGALMEKFRNEVFTDSLVEHLSECAYKHADAMLEARITLPPKQETCTVEEAFGFDK